MRLIDVDAIPENEMNYPVWVCLRKQPTIDAVPAEQFKAQAIDIVKSFEVLVGCTGVGVITKAIERMETPSPYITL